VYTAELWQCGLFSVIVFTGAGGSGSTRRLEKRRRTISPSLASTPICD
jgi:hypothetical protein